MEGAQDRIERIRKGDAHIQFILPNGDTISAVRAFELKQLQHAFYFGGSLAQIGKCLNARGIRNLRANLRIF